MQTVHGLAAVAVCVEAQRKAYPVVLCQWEFLGSSNLDHQIWTVKFGPSRMDRPGRSASWLSWQFRTSFRSFVGGWQRLLMGTSAAGRHSRGFCVLRNLALTPPGPGQRQDVP